MEATEQHPGFEASDFGERRSLYLPGQPYKWFVLAFHANTICPIRHSVKPLANEELKPTAILNSLVE